MRVYVLHDIAANAYSNPVFAENDEVVMRDLRAMLADELTSGSVLVAYPDEFALYYIGDYDPHTGILTGADHIKLCTCGALMPPRSEGPDA